MKCKHDQQLAENVVTMRRVRRLTRCKFWDMLPLSAADVRIRIVCCVREIGGCMVPVWPQYFASACCLLYVVSPSATGQLSAAVVELWGVIQHSDMQVRAAMLSPLALGTPSLISTSA